jgi:uncharacterized protein YecE (DUF72 family)
VTDGQDGTVGALHAGTSGFSYPAWRGGFYPADARPADFLRLYAERLPSVELNTTGYRLPPREYFERWAAETPDGFTFAVKLQPWRLGAEGLSALGSRLGPVRVVVQSGHDEKLVERLLGSGTQMLALDVRHESWEGVEVSPAVRVNDWDAEAPFRYLRFREPPYTDDDLRGIAERIAPLVAAGVDVFAYFRHEDEPTAPAYALRLIELVRSAGDSGTRPA